MTRWIMTQAYLPKYSDSVLLDLMTLLLIVFLFKIYVHGRIVVVYFFKDYLAQIYFTLSILL